MRKKIPRHSRKSKASSAGGKRSPAEPAKTATAAPKHPPARRRTAVADKTSGAGAAPGGRRTAAGRRRAISAGEGSGTEWSLLACEKDFPALVEISPDAIFVHQNGRYVSINPAGVRLLGARHAGEIIGTPVLDHVHPDYREFVRDRIEMSYDLKRVTPLQDARILRLDGTAVPVEATSAPVVVKGRPATLVILRDISWRKQLDEAGRERDRLLRSIFNCPCVLLGVFEDHGTDILFVAANAELSTLYHLRPDALNGRFASQLGVSREAIQEQQRHYDAARQHGAVETWEYQRTWAGRQQWYLATVSYIGRGPGGHHRYTFLAQDITERKKAEASLQRSETEFRGMFELSSVGMAEADPANGRFLRVNRRFCEITGYPEAELLDRTFKDITHPEDRAVDAEKWARVVNGEDDAWHSEKRYVRRDGSVAWVAVNGTCLRDAPGQPFRTVAVIEDVTERKNAETALAETNKLSQALNRINEMIHSTLDTDEIIRSAVNEGCRALDCDSGACSMRDGDRWTVRTVHGLPMEIVGRQMSDHEEQHAVLAITTKRTVAINDAFHDARVNHEHMRKYGIRSVLAVPLFLRGRPLGVIFFNQQSRQVVFTESQLDFTDKLAFAVSLAVENGRLFQERLQIETELRESRKLFDVFMDNNPAIAWMKDEAGRHIYLSGSYEKRIGVRLADWHGKTDSELWPPDIARRFQDNDRLVLERGQAVEVIEQTPSPGGGYTYWLNHKFPFQDAAGRKYIGGIGLDITERKRAEDELQRSHDELEQKVQDRTRELQASFARISLVLESITEGFFAMDREFRLTYVNPVTTRLWGRDQKDLIGRSLWELVPQALGTIFEEQYRKAVAEQVPVSIEARSPASEKWLEVRAYPSGEGLYVFVRDISERRKAEEQRLRLESAISSAGEMVVIADHRGMIQYVNPAFETITGYSRTEALGATMHLLDSGKHDEAFYRELREKLHRDHTWQGQFISRKKDGTVYFEDCTLSLVLGETGEIRNYVSVRRDVTERLRLESIAESIDAMNNIGYIFSGVRHEVGNPINTAKMLLEVLQQKLQDATREAIADYVARALGEIGRVEHLLRNLKNFNLYEKQEPQTVMTAAFLDSFLRLVTEDLAKRGIALSHRIGPGAEELHADPRALQQVLLNLVTNAADAVSGREAPRIDIEFGAGRGAMQLRITDNGVGMTDEERKNLFRPFYTTKPGGTGLGLVIVRKMLAHMGGTIDITSQRDEGTQVEISLIGNGNAAPV